MSKNALRPICLFLTSMHMCTHVHIHPKYDSAWEMFYFQVPVCLWEYIWHLGKPVCGPWTNATLWTQWCSSLQIFCNILSSLALHPPPHHPKKKKLTSIFAICAYVWNMSYSGNTDMQLTSCSVFIVRNVIQIGSSSSSFLSITSSALISMTSLLAHDSGYISSKFMQSCKTNRPLPIINMLSILYTGYISHM